ncbi:hypothetical protein OF83DRAFT_1178839 [Amylostereum chailletii]|nr:hypothetical protein OF83DRAFT_1178839 [Amylostereum chailletii]
MVLMGKRPPKGHRLLVIATTSLRPMLDDLGLSSFDAELRVPPITRLSALDRVLEAVELFSDAHSRKRAVAMLRQTGLDDESEKLNIGIKKLLSTVEMARQEPEAVAERLTSALMGLGILRNVMVSLANARAAIATFKTSVPPPTHTPQPNIYVVSQSKAAAAPLLEQLQALNATGVYHFIETDVSRLGNVERVCAEVAAKETKLDLLYLSAGFISFEGRQRE